MSLGCFCSSILDFSKRMRARWESGHPEDCKSSYAGSSPARASVSTSFNVGAQASRPRTPPLSKTQPLFYTQIASLPESCKRATVLIGNFDGPHLGHKGLIAQARRDRGFVLAVTFRPHTRRFLQPEAQPFLLASPQGKVVRLREWGADAVLALGFDKALATTSAADFATHILANRLYAREVCVGEGFRFGRRRQGDTDLLQHLGQSLGFAVRVCPSQTDCNGDTISSRRIRAHLQAGRIQQANALLGRPFAIHGHVEKGRGLGRRLGFPTANLDPGFFCRPGAGSFVVGVDIRGKTYPAVAYLGTRPKADAGKCKLEVHLFDFCEDLYGVFISVAFLADLRQEEESDVCSDAEDSLRYAALSHCIARDCRRARRLWQQEEFRKEKLPADNLDDEHPAKTSNAPAHTPDNIHPRRPRLP